MKKTLLFLLVGFLTYFVQAQIPLTVKGTVVDASSGEPLIGVSILVVGTNTGAITNIDGKFNISANQNSVLKISYIGYITQEIKISGNNELDIKLSQDSKALDEVVVVGYTVQKRRDVLGAISKVNSDDLNKTPVSSTEQALQGRIAGVNVESQTGAPGSTISVRIRGASSITASNSPLYIVDGIPVEEGLSNISPSDIEDITVLKDASSAAIYGSRASNGVVLITTKKGASGESVISYNTQVGFQMHGHLTPMATTDQYIQLYNEAATTDNANSVVQRELIQGSWLKDFPDENHLENIFRIAPIQTHELSFSGGSEKMQYLLSGSIYNQEGIIKGTDYKRFSLRSNINSQVKKWLKVGLNATGGYSNNRLVSSSGDGYVSDGGSVVRYALFRSPAIPVYDSNGNFVDLPSDYYGNSVYNSFFGDGYSPEGLCVNTDHTKNTKSLTTSGDVLISLPANFFIKTTAGVDYSNVEERVYNKTWGSADRINGTNSLNVSSVESNTWTINSTLNHTISINKLNNFTSMIGTEAIKNATTGLYGSESQFTNTDADFLYLGLGNSKTDVSQSDYGSSLLSFFGNINYNYNQKYYLSGIIREDGSSRFSPENRWGTFYSLSGGWNIETEDFMKSFKNIDKLKLRVGYGAIGNQNIPLYSYSDRMAYNYYYTFGGNSSNGVVQTTLGNVNLKWETSKQLNAGVDLEMLKNTFGATIDYYYKITSNMLLQASLPSSVGDASAPYINSDGTVLNTGVDLEIFYRRNFNDWSFNILMNGGYLYNEVLNMDDPIYGGRVDTGVFATKTETGHPIGSFYLYEMDGIFQNEMEVLTSAYQGKGVKPGDVKYVDQNEDNVIDSKDRIYCGSAIPKFTAGLNLSATYKNLDFSAFFQGAFGQKIFSQVNYDIEGFYRGFNVTERYYEEHWTGEGTSNTQPRASWSAKSNNVRASTRFLEDGSYVRLKNVQLGYTLPEKNRWVFKKVRVFLSATNLLTFTKYSGLDPEMTVSTNSASEGDIANGIDWGTYPVAKNFIFGLNITL